MIYPLLYSNFGGNKMKRENVERKIYHDALSPDCIRTLLHPNLQNINVQYIPTVNSTNTVLRTAAQKGEADLTVLLADAQTNGRGRLGRSFFSPNGSGIYFSILLRPRNHRPESATSITTLAAVALCESIESVFGLYAGIKWVNDIFMDGKKVCGILTEGAFLPGQTALDFAILGIGINLYPPAQGFPDDISISAGSILKEDTENAKNRLIAAFLNQFYRYYSTNDPTLHASAYKNKSIVIGKEVDLLINGSRRPAYVLDIDDFCRLHVQFPDGQKQIFSTGEISLRLQ